MQCGRWRCTDIQTFPAVFITTFAFGKFGVTCPIGFVTIEDADVPGEVDRPALLIGVQVRVGKEHLLMLVEV